MAEFRRRRRRPRTSSCNRLFPLSSSPSLSYIIFIFVCFLSLTTAESKKARNTQSSLYQTLGIPKSCKPEEVKKGYLKAALKHHPDKGGDEETFKEINRAYEVLSDPEKRDLYDQYGQAGLDASANSGSQPQPGPGGTGMPPGGPEFFSSQFFGGQSSRNNNNPGQSYQSFNPGSFFGSAARPTSDGGSNVDLQELLRQMMMDNGSASSSSGTNSRFRANKPSSYTRPLQCSLEELFCGATKKLKVDLGGTSKVYKIKLKPGWKAGTKVKFAATKVLPAIMFVVKEKKHALFQRRGDDLIYRHRLEQPTRETPLHLDILLVDGTRWYRTIPVSYLRAGQSLTIPDHGMPIKGGPERGNLIIEFYDDRDTRSKRHSQ